MKLLLILLMSIGLSLSGALASDWEEDAPKQPAQATQKSTLGSDTVILDDGSNPAKGATGASVLHGSATAVRTRTPAPSLSALQARFAERIAAVQRIDAEASMFLQTARINAIVPPAVFRAFVEKNHPDFTPERNDGQSLLVVRGRWDDSPKPLQSLGLKAQLIKTKDLAESSLSKYKVIVIDCAGEVPKPAIQKVRDFVAQGGYLLTTDWALQNVLEQAFPGFVQWNRDNTDGVITDAFIVDPGSPLLAGVSGRRFTWKLDRLSQCVRVLSPDKVHIIARSSRLSQQDPQLRVLSDPLLAGGLALEFRFGKGRVLHLVGHFDNCSNSFRPLLLPDPAPGAGISLRQVLAANFILEALKKTDRHSPFPEDGDKTAPQ